MERARSYALPRLLSASLLLTLCGWMGVAGFASAQTDAPAIVIPGDNLPPAADKPVLAAPNAQPTDDKPKTDNQPVPEANTAATPKGDVPAAPVPLPAAPAANAGNHFENGIPGSLFLSQQDHIRISNAIADYKNSLLPKKPSEGNTPLGAADNSGGGGDGGNKTAANDSTQPTSDQLQQEAAKDKTFVFPQFFLESLVYHAPGDWSVRVNGKKITPQTLTEDAPLAVVAIDKDAVLFRWKPKEMFRVLEVWDKMPAAQTAQKQDIHNIGVEMKFDSKVLDIVPDMPIIVDKERRLVTFTLRSNQTFSSYAMKVLEGKVLPVTVDNNADLGAAPTPPTELVPALVVPASVPVIDDSISGLNGLMKTINNEKLGGTP